MTITGDDDLIDEAAETVLVDVTGVTNVTDAQYTTDHYYYR